MVKLRRSGRLPYGWITDATRRGYFTPTYGNAGEFLHEMVGLYRADLWSRSNWYCEVWTESRSIAGIIQNTCKELAVALYPTGGFSSLTLAYEAAEFINETAAGKRVCVLYIGDYDPAGVLIDVDLERELRRHLKPGLLLNFHRLGITEKQIAEYDLPRKPRKGFGPSRIAHRDRGRGGGDAGEHPAQVVARLHRATIAARRIDGREGG